MKDLAEVGVEVSYVVGLFSTSAVENGRKHDDEGVHGCKTHGPTKDYWQTNGNTAICMERSGHSNSCSS